MSVFFSPDNTDGSTTPSLDVSSEPIEFEDVTNPLDKTLPNCCKPYNSKTPVPDRQDDPGPVEEQTNVKSKALHVKFLKAQFLYTRSFMLLCRL